MEYTLKELGFQYSILLFPFITISIRKIIDLFNKKEKIRPLGKILKIKISLDR
jgi:uncharacterized membrane protein